MEYLINQHDSKDKGYPEIDQCPEDVFCMGTLIAPHDDAESFSVFGFDKSTGSVWFEVECSRCGCTVTHFGKYMHSEYDDETDMNNLKEAKNQ